MRGKRERKRESEQTSGRESKREKERERDAWRGSSVFKSEKRRINQKSNKLTILLSSVDALIKGK